MIESGPDAAVPLGHVSGAATQEMHSLLDLAGNLGEGHDAQPYRRQLQRQWQSVHQPAQPQQIRQFARAQLELGPDLPGTLPSNR